MKSLNCFLILIFFILFSYGCSSVKEQNKDLYIKQKLIYNVIWENYVGKGTESFYSKLIPAIQNNSLFIADRYGLIKSINIYNGDKIWQKNLSFSKDDSVLLSGGIAIDNNKLYIGSEKSILYSLNARNGNIIWSQKVAGEILSQPKIKKNLVIVYTNNGFLQTFDKKNGSLKWSIKLDHDQVFSLRNLSSPLITFDDIIILGNNTGILSAVDLHQGQIIWQKYISFAKGKTDIEKIVDITSPILLKDKIYILSYNDNLFCLNKKTGEIIWQTNNINGSINELVYDKNNIYIIDKNNSIVAINLNNKKIIWKQDKLSHFSLSNPVLYKNKYIIVQNNKGQLYWIKNTNGDIFYEMKTKNFDIQSFIFLDSDKLLINSKKGKLSFLKIEENFFN